MYACEVHQNVQFISAVLRDKPPDLKDVRVLEVPLDFPFYILETNGLVGVQFEYIDSPRLKHKLNMIDLVEEHDPFFTYMTVYCVCAECQSLNILPGLHKTFISNEWLKAYRADAEGPFAKLASGTISLQPPAKS